MPETTETMRRGEETRLRARCKGDLCYNAHYPEPGSSSGSLQMGNISYM